MYKLHLSVYISFKLLYSIECMYIWLHIAMYNHIYRINAPNRCVQQLQSILTPRALVHATPS